MQIHEDEYTRKSARLHETARPAHRTAPPHSSTRPPPDRAHAGDLGPRVAQNFILPYRRLESAGVRQAQRFEHFACLQVPKSLSVGVHPCFLNLGLDHSCSSKWCEVGLNFNSPGYASICS